MLKGQYVRNKYTKEVHKIEIGDCEEHSKLSSVKIFSPDMSYSYWVDKVNYELTVIENINLVCNIVR